MISGLNNQSVLTSLSRLKLVAQPTTSRSQTPATAVASSSRVTLGSQSEDIQAVYRLSTQKVQSTGNSSATLQGLMSSALAVPATPAFGGLGAAALMQLRHDASDITQVLSSPQTANVAENTGAVALAVTLNITTQTGAALRLNLSRQDGVMTVEMKTLDGALSAEEVDAVAKLSDALQTTLDSLTPTRSNQTTPQIDISALTQFDSQILKSVDLKTNVRKSGADIQSLSFYADNTERALAYTDANFTLKLTTDLSTAIKGSAAQQQAALSSYDQQFDQARIKGHGSSDQMAVMKNAFHALNTTTTANEQFPQQPDTLFFNKDKAQLSGLNDFSASLSQRDNYNNPYRLEEREHFSYSVSQSTTQSQSPDGKRSVAQTAQAHLSASWHEALSGSAPLTLLNDKSTQNYYYHLIEEDSVNTTTLDYNAKGQLASVSRSLQVNNAQTVLKYLRGELIDRKETPENYQTSKQTTLAH